MSRAYRHHPELEEPKVLVVYLASEMAGYITGQCYLANGWAYLQ
jgi:hypothetical protein